MAPWRTLAQIRSCALTTVWDGASWGLELMRGVGAGGVASRPQPNRGRRPVHDLISGVQWGRLCHVAGPEIGRRSARLQTVDHTEQRKLCVPAEWLSSNDDGELLQWKSERRAVKCDPSLETIARAQTLGTMKQIRDPQKPRASSLVEPLEGINSPSVLP